MGGRIAPVHTVTDRVVQQAIAQVLTPIFDPSFSESSFGFRPGRNAHQAIRQVQANVKDGYGLAVDIDLAKFFDTVNHDGLMSLLGSDRSDRQQASSTNPWWLDSSMSTGQGMETPLSGSHLGPHTRPMCPCNKAVCGEAVCSFVTLFNAACSFTNSESASR